jgi:hypothetical protein
LDETYGSGNLSSLDTGAAQRNIDNLSVCLTLAKLYKLKNVIDIGGGDGLLCRLLRDYGINCYVRDRYSEPKYAQGFTEPNFEKPDLVIGFEVLEHLTNPKVDLDTFFNYEPQLLLMTTDLWKQQLSSWDYLMPDTGQHIFFYSPKTLEAVAFKYKYHLLILGDFILFNKRQSPIKDLIAKFLLKRRVLRRIKGLVAMLPAKGVGNDHYFLKEKLKTKSD